MIDNVYYVIVLVSNSVWVFVYRKNKMAAESNIQIVKSKTMPLPLPSYILPAHTNKNLSVGVFYKLGAPSISRWLLLEGGFYKKKYGIIMFPLQVFQN